MHLSDLLSDFDVVLVNLRPNEPLEFCHANPIEGRDCVCRGYRRSLGFGRAKQCLDVAGFEDLNVRVIESASRIFA